ncbi:MAG: TolC family protein, partial [Candidatus Fonsibacter sp.]
MGFFKKFCLLILFISTSAYSAENINKSLISAYLNNPKLNAERERTKAVDENLVQAFSAFKPTVTISAYKSDTDSSKITTSTGSPSPSTNAQTTAKSITIEQKLFNFDDMYNYQKEKNSVEIARYTLKKVEQDILLEAVEAYASTLLAQKKLIFNKENLDLSEKQVELDKSRLERGIITISDLAQSESSLAAAQSNLLNAENELLIAKKNFKNVIGYDPVDLQEINNLNLNLPKSLEETSVSAQKDNPILKISEFSLKKAEDEHKIAIAELSPTFSLSLGITDYDGYSSSVDKTKQSVAKAQASIPLYQGGKQTSLIIQKKSL